ncbi:MAG TPA: glycosyltransferase, partial [Telluria sp.]|nr:glycosyltransferase [Telluria sp.]
EELGGLGEVEHALLPAFAARYRFLFSPIRYTSMGLSVIEAMMAGVPVVALATTEMATVVEHEITGFACTDLEHLIGWMRILVRDLELAREVGEAGRRCAAERFSIERFSRDWDAAFRLVTGA